MKKDYEEILHRENITLADNKKRILSFVIDDLLISLIVLASFGDKIFGADVSAKEWIEATQGIVFEVMCLKIAYQTFFVWYYGATIGKIITKIRVIELDTMANPTVFVSLIRASIRIASEIFFYLGFFPAFFDKLRQTVQDKIARTVVVNV